MTASASAAASALCAGASLAALLSAHPALAQDAAPGAVDLPPITVEGAFAAPRALLDAPVAASVAEGAALERRQADNFHDLIGDMPGLQIDGGPRGMAQEPNIRGFQDDQIVLRFDGGRQNFNQAHRGRFFVDPAIVQRIEVVRGGGSTLHGSGALGGVISVETKDADDLLRPGETWGGRLHAGWSSNGGQWKLGATGYGRYGDVDWLGYAGWRPMTGDVTDGGGAEIRSSKVDVRNALGKIGWEPTAADRIELSASRYEDDGTVPAAANSLGDAATDVDRDATVHTARLSWDHAPADNPYLDLSAIAYWNGLAIEEDRGADGRADATDYDTFGLDIRNSARLSLGVPVVLTLGAEALRDVQSGTRDGSARSQFPDATADTLSAYAEAAIEATDWLQITPGVRVDRYSRDPDAAGQRDVEETFVSPRLGVSIRPTPSLQVWGNVARAFRAPSLTELYNDGAHFAIPGFPLGPGLAFSGVNRFVPNPDLEPEETVQIEAGVRFEEDGILRPGDRVSLSVNGYYADAKNFIDQTVAFMDFSTFNPITGTVDGTTTTTNVDAKLWGAELEARYDAGGWFAAAGVSVPRGEAADGSSLGSIPQDRVTATVGWRPNPELEVGAKTTYAFAKSDVPAGSVPAAAWTKVDVFASWTPQDDVWEGAEFRAGVDNIFDAEYAVYPNGLNQAGRSFKLQAAFQF